MPLGRPLYEQTRDTRIARLRFDVERLKRRIVSVGAGELLGLSQIETVAGLVEITSTDPDIPTDLVDGPTLTFDGSQTIEIILAATTVDIDQRGIGNTGALLLELYDNGAPAGIIFDFNASNNDYAATACYVSTILTPTAGDHVFSVKGYKQAAPGGSIGAAHVFGSGVETPHATRPGFLAVLAASSAVPAATDPGGIPLALIDAVGDLIVGIGPDAAGRLGVGSNGQVLTADSGAPAGVAWEDLPADTDAAGGAGGVLDVGNLATQVAGSTISNGKYNAFGILAELPDGTLVLVYREATDHVGSVGVLKMRKSGDQGRTWSSATTIASETGVDLRNVGGGVTSSGRIVVFYGRYSGSFLSQAFITSDDDGTTWSAATTVTHGSNTEYSPYGQMIEAAGGTLLLTWYGDDGTHYTSYVIASTDNGATWAAPVTIATSTSSKYTETSLAYLGGSYILALLRTDNGTTFSQALSTDNGATWTVQGTTSFDSWSTPSPPQLAVYETARGKREIACYYYNRTASKMRVSYCSADAIIAATLTGWSAPADLATGHAGDGYPGVVHPLASPAGVGWFYDETSSSVADIKFFIATGGAHATEGDLDLADVTTDDVSSTRHGFAPKSPADATKFLTGAATPGYAQVKDSDLSLSDITTNDVSTVKHGLAPKAPNDTSKFLSGDGTWRTPASSSTWSVLTNGNPTSPELVFAGGDVIMVVS